jgi:nucleotide-binding universal stress UspA family protein
MSFERILLPTDGSSANRRAEARAIELAAESGAALDVLHVLEHLALPFDEHADALRETLASEAEAFVGEVVERARDAGVREANWTVTKGRPHESIVETAEDHGCDLVVMGTHGRAEHDPYVPGSITARALQRSPVEVLVVPTRGTDE